MKLSDLYDLEYIPYGITDWVGAVNADFAKIEANMHTRLLVTLGEACAANQLIKLRSDGYWYKASRLYSARRPAFACLIESGGALSQRRAIRRGPIYVSGGTYTPGGLVYLGVSGAFTQTEPASNKQIVGYAIDAENVYIDLDGIVEALATTTTTTSSSSSTSTSSTASTISTISTTSSTQSTQSTQSTISTTSSTASTLSTTSTNTA